MNTANFYLSNWSLLSEAWTLQKNAHADAPASRVDKSPLHQKKDSLFNCKLILSCFLLPFMVWVEDSYLKKYGSAWLLI